MAVKICAVTSSRADYGILSPLLKRIDGDPFFELTIAATGTHLLPAYGYTVQEIVDDGFRPAEIPIIAADANDSVAVSDVMAEALRRFSRFFQQGGFNLLLALGDRYEMAAICCAAVNARLPIAHIHGGEITEGAIDECYRHAITKMSVLHFTACEAYRKRVIQLGEHPDRVFNVGALCVENIRGITPYPLAALSEEVGLPLENRPYAIVTFHPVTQEAGTAMAQLCELMKAMEQRQGLCYLITKANADESGSEVNAAWDAFAARKANCAVVASLGMRRYLSALRGACMMLGNSSSGILEAPICGVPTVNIGDRQRGRLRTLSIVDCRPLCADILQAMAQVYKPGFQEQARTAPCPYGDGTASVKIAAVLKEWLSTRNDVKKSFYDI